MKKNSPSLLLMFTLPLVLLVCSGAGDPALADTAGNGSPATSAGPDAEDYLAAAGLLSGNLRGLVKNQTVVPHVLADSGTFWYRRDLAQGHEYVTVEAATGEKRAAFDHAALAEALAGLTGTEIKATGLPLTQVVLSGANSRGDISTLTASLNGQQIRCELSAMQCDTLDVPAPEPGVLPSQSGRWAAITRDDNLHLIDQNTGKQRPLTTDGASLFSYGKYPESGLINIPMKKSGLKLPPIGVHFSPDDRYLISTRLDERDLAVYPFLESVPTDGSLLPVVHNVRLTLPGDRAVMKSDHFIHDLASGTTVPISVPQGYELDSSNPLGWNLERQQLFMLASSYGLKQVALLRIDLRSGQASTVIEEAGSTRVLNNSILYNVPNVRIIGNGTEVIWFSERSGWGHLYLYDAQTGELKRRLTEGPWLVQDIHLWDADRRELYFTAGGREPGHDPYYRHLYKLNVDEGESTLLTDTNADHHFAPEATPFFAIVMHIPPTQTPIFPELGVFIDTSSTVDTPPVTVLRSSADGSVITMLETADASALYARGWQAPVREVVKAADGETDLYAVYYPPLKALPGGRHPVLDAAYGGPQVSMVPRNFVDAYSARTPGSQSAHARLGFAVVTIDGRGTPLRSKAFSDYGYPEFSQVGIDDHIAAIRQLADKYPAMDTGRVGIYGWSWGGTFAAQAILSRPEFYQVSVAGAGIYDYASVSSDNSPFVGLPQYADGSIYRTAPDEKPANWDRVDITQLAGNLRGKLMLIYGDADENVPPVQTVRLIDALVKANKRFDLIHIPNATHGSANGETMGYTMQRQFDHFVEYLLNADPPSDVDVTYGGKTP